MKVLIDYGFLAILQHYTIGLALQRGIGIGIEVLWISALLVSWAGARRARRLAEQFGIDLIRSPAQDSEPTQDASDRA